MKINLQLTATMPVFLPKATVYVPPIGSPQVTYHNVAIAIPGLLANDDITNYNLEKSTGGILSANTDFTVVSVSDDELVIYNRSTTTNFTLASGYIDVSREVEPFKNYSGNTDVDGLITVEHNLYYTPTKYVATAHIGANDEHITLAFVSADDTYATFQAFSGGSALANSALDFSAQLM